jgi:hypothetical protein
LCVCQYSANSRQSWRIEVTPSAQRPNRPVRNPVASAPGEWVMTAPIVATISTGDRRSPLTKRREAGA